MNHNYTGANDFNTTAFEVTFSPNEGETTPIAEIPAFISIVDDEINEADHQYFIVFLEIIGAVNFDLIEIGRNVSTCIIIDNDGE